MGCYYYYSHKIFTLAAVWTCTLDLTEKEEKKQAQLCTRFACNIDLMCFLLD